MSSTTTPQSSDHESKEDEELGYNRMSKRPARQQILNILRPLHHEELVDLVVSLIDEDPTIFSVIQDRIGTNEAFRKVFVHGLPPDTTETELRALFEKFGSPELVKVVMDRTVQPPKSKGYGFVVYPTIEEAHNALREPTKWFGGKEICCKLSMRSSASDENHNLPPNVHSRKIFISGLQYELKEDQLHEYFSNFGTIEYVQLAVDANGEGKGYGFVTYTHSAFARQAIISTNRKMWRGRPLVVTWCRKREDEEARLGRKHSAPINNMAYGPANPNVHWQQAFAPGQFSIPTPTAIAAAAASGQWPGATAGYSYVSASPYIYIPVPMVQQPGVEAYVHSENPDAIPQPDHSQDVQ